MKTIEIVKKTLPYALGAAAGFSLATAVDLNDDYEEAILVSDYKGDQATAKRRHSALSGMRAAAFVAGGIAALSAGLNSRGSLVKSIAPILIGGGIAYAISKMKGQ